MLLHRTFSFEDSVDCKCFMNDKDFGEKTPVEIGDTLISISTDDYSWDQTNFGKLVSVKGIIFTQENFLLKKGEKRAKFNGDLACPEGFRLMSRWDLQEIEENFRGDLFWKLTDTKLINLPLQSVFLTGTKAHPKDFSEEDSAFEFYGTLIKSNVMEMKVTLFNLKDPGSFWGKCVMESHKTNESLVMAEDLIADIPRKRSIFRDNAIDYDVDLTGGITVRGKPIFEFTPTRIGCFYLKIKWKMWEGSIKTSCESFVVRPLFGSSHETSITQRPIYEMIFREIHANRNLKIHSGYASAPMAAKPFGGAYLLYSEKPDLGLKVLDLDESMKEISKFDLKIFGFPLAFQAYNEGFFVYYRDVKDKNKSVLASFFLNGTMRWKQFVMDNGNQPISVKNQFQFFDKNAKLVKGMEAMYKPGMARIAVGRKRLMLIFNHSNNFKANEGGFEGYSGDSTISMDFNGNNIFLGDPWGTSHSLSQQIVYDGKQFVTSALGDGYPQQIRFTRNDGRHTTDFIDGVTLHPNRFEYQSTADIVIGDVPGNGRGQSCGRLGGLHVIGLKEFEKYAQVYSRVKCVSGLDNQTRESKSDEIGVVFFDRNLKRLGSHVIGKGSNVNMIKSAVYGKNIFIIYTTTTRQSIAGEPFLPDDYDDHRDEAFMMLVDTEGKVITEPIDLKKFLVGNDDLVTLHDGNVAWSFVNKDGVLEVYSLAKPDHMTKGDVDLGSIDVQYIAGKGAHLVNWVVVGLLGILSLFMK